MNNIIKFVLLIMVLCTVTLPVTAEQDYQAQAISTGNLADAEKQLLGVLDRNPDDPYALLNLAFVCQKAGDQEKARAIYYRILALKNNPYAELASGDTERVKSIAQRGIDRVETR
jgi:Flp pilus assembly protein TadD